MHEVVEKDKLISIIMPAYNEASHIEKNIRETKNVFDGFGCPYEIIVMDDGSSDDTYEKVRLLTHEIPNVHVRRNRTNFGKGRTLKKAFRHTKGDYIVFLDSDLDLHPKQVQGLFSIMKSQGVDVVIGSKRHPQSKLNYPIARRFVSTVYFLLVKILFKLPIHDTQTGLKLFKRSVLKDVFPKILVKKYAYDLEILVLAHHFGYKIAEAPVTIHFQRSWGRIGFRSIYDTWIDTMAIFYRMYILHYYDKKE